jgi:hypothetical protein
VTDKTSGTSIHSRYLLLAGSVAAVVAASALNAQTSLADQKTQAEINKLEAEQQKITLDTLAATRTAGIAGTTGVTAPEVTAEGRLLVRRMHENAAASIVAAYREWLAANPNRTGRVSIVFGDQPPSVAEYLAIRTGFNRLKSNLELATRQWDSTRGQKMFFDPLTISLVLTGITTVASMLRTNTTIAGATINTPQGQFRAILLAALIRAGLPADQPRTIAGEPEEANRLFTDLEPARVAARRSYDAYLEALRAAQGKPENLTANQRIAAANLTSALAEYDTLHRALYTPVNGMLPATQLDEQVALFNERDRRPILYIYSNEASLTTTTRQGILSGIGGVPAYVSASSVIDYGFAGDTPRTGRIITSTPVMRLTAVRAWLNPPANPAPAERAERGTRGLR